MKFNFRKIASVLASAAMLGSTIGVAAAANMYPAPFVVGGTGDVAIVYGSATPDSQDLASATVLSTDLASKITVVESTTASDTATPLFTSSTKIYVNDTLNSVKSVLTKSELPVTLAKETISGNAEATITQTMDIGSNPRLIYARQPTSSDDPVLGIGTSTTRGNYIYNVTASFSKTMNFTHVDTKGQSFKMFGQKFTVSSSTDATNLVLLKSAEKVDLTNDNPTKDVTVDGKKYTVELVSASDTSATIKITNEAGTSETKEISEAASKKVNGLTIAVDTADETNLKLSASVIAGAQKVTITDASSITTGDESTVVDGTYVDFVSTTNPHNISQLRFSVYAASSDKDSIFPGKAFVDPVFGSFKIDFTGLNIAESDADKRETLTIRNSGNDTLTIKLTPQGADEKELTWAFNTTGAGNPSGILLADGDGRNITIREGAQTFRSEQIVVGNQEEGRLVKVSTISNSSSTDYNQDKVEFTDVFLKDDDDKYVTYTTSLTSEGAGTVTIGGKSYTVTYSGTSDASEESRSVRLNYPDSSGAGSMVVYPTIQTSKGARLWFYKPLNISYTNWDGTSNNLTQVRFPDGDGYTDVTFASDLVLANGYGFNVTFGTTTTSVNASIAGSSASGSIGRLTYNFTSEGLGANRTTIYLVAPTGAIIKDPAVAFFEEKDDNSNYEATIVDLEAGTTSDDGIGVNNVYRSWLASTNTGGTDNFADTLASSSQKTKISDLWGTITLKDGTDNDQAWVSISYPDEQVYAKIYADVAAGSATSSGVVQVVKDTEVDSVKTKNLIVVGGSCINTVARMIVSATATGAVCGEDWTAATTVGAGQYLIQVVKASEAVTGGSESKVAVLVAGYEAAETANAVTKLKEGTVATDAGTKYIGPQVG